VFRWPQGALGSQIQAREMKMWLLTMHEWVGTRDERHLIPRHVSERQVAFVTRASLDEGLRLIADYKNAYAARYGHGSVLDLRLLSASEIPDDTSIAALEAFHVAEINRTYIERLSEVRTAP
jgi:hypothetical protein